MSIFIACKVLLLGGFALASASAQAATLFTDGFEGYAGDTVLNWNQGGAPWSTSDGTVDLVRTPNTYGIVSCAGGSATCVDLDGSTNNAGVLSRSFDAVAGTTYILSAQISGSDRTFAGPDEYRNVPNSALFGFRDASSTEFGVATVGPLGAASPFNLYSTSFIAPTSGAFTLFFADQGSDSVGLLLDNVSLQAVPLPAAAWLLLSGLAAVGMVARRRRTGAGAATPA